MTAIIAEVEERHDLDSQRACSVGKCHIEAAWAAWYLCEREERVVPGWFCNEHMSLVISTRCTVHCLVCIEQGIKPTDMTLLGHAHI